MQNFKDFLAEEIRDSFNLTAKEKVFLSTVVLMILEEAEKVGQLHDLVLEDNGWTPEMIDRLLHKLRTQKAVATMIAAGVQTCDDPACESCKEVKKLLEDAGEKYDLASMTPAGNA